MNYFGGINIFFWNHYPHCDSWIDKAFDYYVLDYAHSGNLELAIDDEPPVVLDAPVAWLTFPAGRFQFGSRDRSPRWDHRFVAFTGPRVQHYLESALFPIQKSPPVIPIRNPEMFRQSFDELLAVLNKRLSPNPRAVYLLEGLLLQLSEQDSLPNMPSDLEDQLIELATDIQNHPALPWNFEMEAEKLNISYSHFRRVFRQLFRRAPQQYVLQMRMARAAELLHYSNLEIKVIAEQVNCPDVYYFTKLFKRFYTMPPGKYRVESRL